MAATSNFRSFVYATLSSYESFISSFFSPSLLSNFKTAEYHLISFFNPKLQTYKSANGSINFLSPTFPMTSLFIATFNTFLYLLTIFVLYLVVKRVDFGKEKEKVSAGKNSLMLNGFMMGYNVVQVVLCWYMFTSTIEVITGQNYSYLCNEFHATSEHMARVYYVFHLSKILDFFDTIFIILKRNFRQLSFLHVYHHASVYFFSFLNTRAGFDGDVYYTVMANSFVHVVMYFYYLVTLIAHIITDNTSAGGVLNSFGKVLSSSLMKVKKYVTFLQMFQFVTMLIQASLILLGNEDFLAMLGFKANSKLRTSIFGERKCEYPMNLMFLYFAYVCSMLALFGNFSRRNYYRTDKVEKGKVKTT